MAIILIQYSSGTDQKTNAQSTEKALTVAGCGAQIDVDGAYRVVKTVRHTNVCRVIVWIQVHPPGSSWITRSAKKHRFVYNPNKKKDQPVIINVDPIFFKNRF